MTALTSDCVVAGRLAGPHGIRGDIRVELLVENTDLLLGEAWLQAGDRLPVRAEIASVRQHRGTPVVHLKGVEDRTAAAALRGMSILIPEARLPELDEDEFYIDDLTGLPVFLTDGSRIGTLDEAIDLGEQETWRILTDDGREILLPAVPEFVVSIHLEDGIVIRPPEGLLELYLKP